MRPVESAAALGTRTFRRLRVCLAAKRTARTQRPSLEDYRRAVEKKGYRKKRSCNENVVVPKLFVGSKPQKLKSNRNNYSWVVPPPSATKAESRA